MIYVTLVFRQPLLLEIFTEVVGGEVVASWSELSFLHSLGDVKFYEVLSLDLLRNSVMALADLRVLNSSKRYSYYFKFPVKCPLGASMS